MENVCKKCGRPISRRAEYCTDHRRYRSLAKRTSAKPDVTKRCKFCGKEFTTKNEEAAVCSIPCRNRLNSSGPRTFTYPDKECETCKKAYTPVSSQQKYCSQGCLSKAHRLRHPEYYKERDRIKVRKQSIGLNIRNEHLGNPTKEAKWLWDGIGKWSVKYWPDITECLECNTNVYRHCGNGICMRCFDKLKARDEERLNELKKKSHEKRKQSGKLSQQVAKTWIEKAKNQEIPITPKIGNLLDNLERL